MSTYFQSKEDAQKASKWLLIDASGIPLGRLASEVAGILRGKHKRTYTPHIEGGDFVIVLNAEKVGLSGKKRDDAIRRHHTGYMGGLKEVKVSEILTKHPERLIKLAVRGMFHKSALTHSLMGRLKVYSGESHPHVAQRPEKYPLKCVRKSANN